MKVREIIAALRRREDVWVESEDGNIYVGGDLLDVDEYQIGAGCAVGPLALDGSRCSCGEWSFNAYLGLPGNRRLVFQAFSDVRPTFLLERLLPAAS